MSKSGYFRLRNTKIVSNMLHSSSRGIVQFLLYGVPILGTEDTTGNNSNNNNKTLRLFFSYVVHCGGGSINNCGQSYSSSNISASPICGI